MSNTNNKKTPIAQIKDYVEYDEDWGWWFLRKLNNAQHWLKFLNDKHILKTMGEFPVLDDMIQKHLWMQQVLFI